MGGIYRRGNKLWLWYFDAAGVRVFQATGSRPGEEDRARKTLEAIERRVEAEGRTGIPTGELTVKAYGERWMKGRPGQGVSTAEDEARRLRLHAWPLIGAVLLKDLRPHHVRDMVRALRSKKSALGTPLAPRTVRHVYGTLHTLLHDAVVDELVETNPCVLKRGELPRKIDKNPEWRDGATFTRDEAERLISDPRIPEDRRVWNALLLLAGLRAGEAAALRWRHFDAKIEPLGRLAIAGSWDSRLGVETSTKTERPRGVPVHPTLARILAGWKLGGYERLYGRAPGLDDLIAPNRDGQHRNPQRAIRRFHADLTTLGLRVRRQHDCRRAFTSLARGDGAQKDLIDWVTHGPSSSIVDVYTSMPWASLCAEVAKLKLELREGKLLQLPRAVTSGACDSPCDSDSSGMKKPPSRGDLRACFTEREKGFEPSTPALARRCSTTELFPLIRNDDD